MKKRPLLNFSYIEIRHSLTKMVSKLQKETVAIVHSVD